nr:MAG TPA: hypothetical protein [Caudoviricetes sp.]
MAICSVAVQHLFFPVQNPPLSVHSCSASVHVFKQNKR